MLYFYQNWLLLNVLDTYNYLITADEIINYHWTGLHDNKNKNNTFSCSHFLLVQRRTFFLFLNFFLAYDKDET